MVRSKARPRKSEDLYPSESTLLNVSTHSRAESSSSSSGNGSRQQNSSNDSHNKLESKRKSIPRKNTSTDQTKVFVEKRTAVINKSGRKQNIKFKVLRDIKFLQATVHNLIPKSNFSRVVSSIMLSNGSEIKHFSSTGLEALQEAAETYLTCLFADCNILARHAKRKTIKPIDMALVMNMRGNP